MPTILHSRPISREAEASRDMASNVHATGQVHKAECCKLVVEGLINPGRCLGDVTLSWAVDGRSAVKPHLALFSRAK